VIGGSNSEQLRGVSVDANGNVWFTGFTNSWDVPVIGSTRTFQSSNTVTDATIGKITPGGAVNPGPEFITPVTDQQINADTVTFSWNSVPGATSYELKVDNRDTQTQVTLISTTLTTRTLALTSGFYAGRIRACFGGGNSNCSAYCSRNFRMVNTANNLGIPTIANPVEGSTITSSIINFQWSAVGGATSYDLRIYKITGSTSSLDLRVSVIGGDTNAIYTYVSGTYRMEIRACNNSGCGLPGISNFVVQLPPPPTGAVTGLTCAVVNDAGVNRLNCNWNALAGADFYFIHVIQQGQGPGGGALTVAGTSVGTNSSSFQVPNGNADVIVRGCNGDGCGPFSSAAQITPNFGNPNVPSLGDPISGIAVDSGANAPIVTFTWNRVAGDNGQGNFVYRLFVQNFNLNSAALDVQTTNNFYAAFFNPFTRYDVLVIAIPVAGGAPRTGPAKSFIARGAIPNAVHNVTPTTFSSSPAGAKVLGWSGLPDADGNYNRNYQFEFGNGTAGETGVTTATSVSRTLAPGNWVGRVRACTTGTACTANSNTGWGIWNNESGSQGGSAVFNLQ